MYILSIDQGTTGTTALLINSKTFEILAKVNKEFPQIFPQPGWVEHDLNDIWDTVTSTITDVLEKVNASPNDIQTIGITNQRETTCAFQKDGKPLTNAIVWQDRRTSEVCENLKKKDLESLYKKKAGLPLDPYFSGTKMKWLLENNKIIKDAYQRDDLLFGTIDTFLLYKLSNCVSYKTDVSNASRTLLMDLEKLNWSDELLSHLNIPKQCLPTICDSISDFGITSNLDFLPDGIKISGILGDQQAALFGQACFDSGTSKCTYGTGAFMLTNTGSEIKYSTNGLLTTVAFKYKDQIAYALEGSSYIAGACVQWLRDNLDFFQDASEIESLANNIKDLKSVKDVYMFPFFTGIGSPYWKPDAKAAIIGLTRDTGKAEISRAALEGIAFSINDLITAMNSDLGTKIKSLNVDGGAVANDLLLNLQSAISELKIIRPKIIETTAFGAGLAAAIGANIASFEDVRSSWSIDKSFINSDNKEYFEHKKSGWNNYITKTF